MPLDVIELWFGRVGGVAGLATLAIALTGVFWSVRQPAGREEQGARVALRWPILLLATIAFFGIGIVLWRPLPIQLTTWARAVMLLVGGVLFFGGLGLYLWGLTSLGRMFGPSSGFGVRLHAGHRLVTRGVYAHIRHPMYLGVIATGTGGFLLYRTWAALCFAVIMLGLVIRARREEKMLAREFGAEWQAYVSRVPAWLPRLRRGGKGSA